jgi:hypothetical protein
VVLEIARRLLQRYPKNAVRGLGGDDLATIRYEMADYDQMASLYEGMIDAFPGDPTAMGNLDRAASLR